MIWWLWKGMDNYNKDYSAYGMKFKILGGYRADGEAKKLGKERQAFFAFAGQTSRGRRATAPTGRDSKIKLDKGPSNYSDFIGVTKSSKSEHPRTV